MYTGTHTMEESLKSFLIDEQSDHYNSAASNFHKYNNLKIYFDVKRSKIPHFIVRIGISEAMFDIASFNLMSGSLGSDNKYIRRWAERILSKEDIKELWDINNKLEEIVLAEAAE